MLARFIHVQVPSQPHALKHRAPAVSAIGRVAWLHSHFLMWAGGTKFVFEVARRLNRTIPVDMIVERCAPEIAKMYADEGMRVIEISNRSSTSMLYWGLFPLQLAREVRRLRKLKANYSAFIASMFPMSAVAVAAGAHPLTTYLMEPFAFFHDEDMIAGFSPPRRQLLEVLARSYRWLDRWGVRHSEQVLTINSGTARWVQQIYGRQADTTLLGVDTQKFAPRPSRFAEQWEGRRIVVHSTDFTPLKRTSVAIDAVAALRADLPSVLLLITCSFDDAEKIAELRDSIRRRGLQDHVVVLGSVSHDDLPHYYARAHASLYTGIGKGASAASLFVLECMACGTPGIRTDFTEDEVAHGESGFLFAAQDEQALRNHLRTLLTDEPLRARFGVAARERVVATYSWDAVAERVTRRLLGENQEPLHGAAS